MQTKAIYGGTHLLRLARPLPIGNKQVGSLKC